MSAIDIRNLFSAPIEYGWNELATNAVKLRGDIWRLNGSKSPARITANALKLGGKVLTIKLRGAPSTDPAFNQGVWVMVCDEFGKETGAELDLIEFCRFNKLRGYPAWISYRDSQYDADGNRVEGDMRGFEPGASDEWTVEAHFLDGVVYVYIHTRFEGVRMARFEVPITYGNLKIGAFAIPNEKGEPEFAFKRTIDRGNTTWDVLSVTLEEL